MSEVCRWIAVGSVTPAWNAPPKLPALIASVYRSGRPAAAAWRAWNSSSV